MGHLLRLYDLSSGLCLRNLYGHSARVTALAFDRRRLASGDEDGNILIWDIDRKDGEEGEKETPSNVLFTVQGQKVAGLAIMETKRRGGRGREDDAAEDVDGTEDEDDDGSVIYSGLHAALQKGTMIYLDFLAATS